jgi:hypothetical protein
MVHVLLSHLVRVFALTLWWTTCCVSCPGDFFLETYYNHRYLYSYEHSHIWTHARTSYSYEHLQKNWTSLILRFIKSVRASHCRRGHNLPLKKLLAVNTTLMSNLGFEPEWISSTTRNLTSWAKPTLHVRETFYFKQIKVLFGYSWDEQEWSGLGRIKFFLGL